MNSFPVIQSAGVGTEFYTLIERPWTAWTRNWWGWGTVEHLGDVVLSLAQTSLGECYCSLSFVELKFISASILCPVLRALVGAEMCIGLRW